MTQSPSLRAPGTTWSPQTLHHCEPQAIPGPRNSMFPAPAIFELPCNTSPPPLAWTGPLLGPAVTWGNSRRSLGARLNKHEQRAKTTRKISSAASHACVLHIIRLQWGPCLALDSGGSGLQGFVEGAMHSMGLTHTAGGHAWRGTRSRIILGLARRSQTQVGSALAPQIQVGQRARGLPPPRSWTRWVAGAAHPKPGIRH